jgi:cation diffusion facilitator family transporter
MKSSHDHPHNQHDKPTNLLRKIIGTVFHTHSHTEQGRLSPADTTEEGIRAVKISFVGLMITAVLQVFVVIYTQSVALLADTVHNFSDAFSSIPLWIAFVFSRRSAKKSRYPYGYGKAEDLAGLFIIFLIAASAVLVFVESIGRLFNPISPTNLGVLTIAAIIGYLGNELVARYRISVGKRIQSEALIADGLHSRTDAYVSLSVIIGAIGAYFGVPIIDPLVGIIIGIMILFILRDASKRIWLRLMDGIDPTILETLRIETEQVEKVAQVVETRARWVGRSLYAEIEVIINRDYTVADAYTIEEDLKRRIQEKMPFVSSISIIDIPCNHHKKLDAPLETVT